MQSEQSAARTLAASLDITMMPIAMGIHGPATAVMSPGTGLIPASFSATARAMPPPIVERMAIVMRRPSESNAGGLGRSFQSGSNFQRGLDRGV